MKRTAVLFAGMILFCGARAHGGTGSTSATFLQESMSARLIGMGGITAVAVNGSASMNTNPSGLALGKKPEISLSYASTQDQSRHAFVAYSHPIFRSSPLELGVGSGIHYYTAGNLDINYADGTTKTMTAETGYSGFFSVGIRYAGMLAFGISPKMVRSTLVDQFSGTALAVDTCVRRFILSQVL